MADIKITDLAAYTDPVSTDVLPIVDVGSDLTKKVSIADLLENAGTGSASAPSFSFDGDNDTGIYRPAADQVALSAGGTQALLAESTGITIPGTTTATGLISADGKVSFPLGTAALPSLYPGSDVNTGIYSPGADQVAISTNGSQRLLIDASGNVTGPTSLGINGASPQSSLDVIASASGYGASFRGRSADNLVELRFASNNHASVYSSLVSGPTYLAASVNGSERMRIDSSGRVGIGTSLPDALLTISSSNSASVSNSRLRLIDTDTTAVVDQYLGRIEFFGSDTTGAGAGVKSAITAKAQTTGGDSYLTFSTSSGGANDIERMRIDSSGNVGIGTNSPAKILDLQSTDALALRFFNSTSFKGGIEVATSAGQMVTTSAVDDFCIRSNENILFGLSGGNEAVRIDSSGNVGIGTSTVPTGLLLGNSLTVSSSTGAEIIAFRNDSATADGDTCGAILIGNSDNGGTKDHFAGMWAKGDGASGGMDLHFAAGRGGYESDTPQFTILNNGTINASGDVGIGGTLPSAPNISLNANGSATFANGDVNIDSSGNVGIGTTSPTERLHVESASNTTIRIDNEDDSTAKLYFHNTGSTDMDISVSSANMTFNHGATERLRIDSSGNVGIGTSSPARILDIRSAGSAEIRLADSTNIGRDMYIKNNDGAFEFRAKDRNSDGSFVFLGYGAEVDNEFMRIDSSGNVGIGTTSPGRVLEIKNAAPIIRLTDTDNNYSEISANSSVLSLRADESNGTADTRIDFKVDGTERARIDSSGRLLVGTSSSVAAGSTTQATLQVNQGAGVGAAFYSTANAAGPGGLLVLGHGRGSASGLLSTGDAIGDIRFAAGDGTDLVTQGARIHAEVDGTPGADDMPGRLVFSTTADGASSPTERMRIGNSGTINCFADGAFNLRVVGTSSANIAFSVRNAATDISNGTNKCIIRGDGDLENTNNSYGAISDIKLKENIVDASSQWDDLKALQVRKYNFKEETGHDTHTQLGLVAQEVELVSPGLVSESPDRDDEGNDLGTVTKSVNYSVLYMKAVKALQEAMERIEVLEQRLSDAGIA